MKTIIATLVAAACFALLLFTPVVDVIGGPTHQPLPGNSDGSMKNYTCKPCISSHPQNNPGGNFTVTAGVMLVGWPPQAWPVLDHPTYGLMQWNDSAGHYKDMDGTATFTPEDGVASYIPKDPVTGDLPPHIHGGYSQTDPNGGGHSGYTIKNSP